MQAPILPKLPMDGTQYAGRDMATPGNGGMGTIVGYQPISVMDPLKPWDTLDKLTIGPLIYEHENDVGGHQIDAQWHPQAAPAELAVLCGTLKGVRKRIPVTRALGFYTLSWLNPSDVDNPLALARYDTGMLVFAKSGILDLVDFVVLACPWSYGVPLALWARSMRRMVSTTRRMHKSVKIVVQVGEQWHQASGENAQAFIPAPEASAMFALALHEPEVHTVERHGGYRGSVSHLEYGSNPAEAAINQILTGAPSGKL